MTYSPILRLTRYLRLHRRRPAGWRLSPPTRATDLNLGGIIIAVLVLVVLLVFILQNTRSVGLTANGEMPLGVAYCSLPLVAFLLWPEAQLPSKSGSCATVSARCQIPTGRG
jgi:uncharacterized integral membrane protein